MPFLWSPFMLISFDLAKDCKHLSDDFREKSWYELVTDPQYTQVIFILQKNW